MNALCLVLVLAGHAVPAAGVDSVVGIVRVQGSAINTTVSVVHDHQSVRLQGELVREIRHLQSVKVEVLGKKMDHAFMVADYRILDVGGGNKPWVGQLVRLGAGGDLALRDGSGTPLPLSLPPRSHRRLARRLGAKVWVSGKKLVSGQIQVLRYGVLRAPPRKPKRPAKSAAPTPPHG